MKLRLIAAATTASIGTAVFLALGFISRGLFGSFFEAGGCFVGALLAATAAVRPGFLSLRANLLPAVFVVIAALLGIAAAHAAEQALVRGVPVDEEWRGLLLWAVLTTSWWLVPATAWVLALCNRHLLPQEPAV